MFSLDVRTNIKRLLALANAWTGNQTLNDNVTLGFGTSNGESTLKSDGSDTIWQMAQGGLTIGLAASAPSPDQNGVHIWAGTAGTVTAVAGSLLTLEVPVNTAAYISFLMADGSSSTGGIVWGLPSDNDFHILRIRGDVVGDPLEAVIGGVDNLRWTSGAFAFQLATTISTTATTLTLSPATNLLLGAGKAFQSSGAAEIGINVTNSALTVGSLGSIIVPVKTSGTTPTDAEAGDLVGAIIFNSSDSKLYVRTGTNTFVSVSLA